MVAESEALLEFRADEVAAGGCGAVDGVMGGTVCVEGGEMSYVVALSGVEGRGRAGKGVETEKEAATVMLVLVFGDMAKDFHSRRESQYGRDPPTSNKTPKASDSTNEEYAVESDSVFATSG